MTDHPTIATAPDPANRAESAPLPDPDAAHADDAAVQRIERELAALFARSREYKRRTAAGIHPSLQPAAYGLMRILADRGPARGSVLSELIGIDRSAVTRLAQGLERLGLVARVPDEEDGRAALLALTAEGTSRMAAARCDHAATLRQTFAGWSQDDIVRFAALLGRFNDDAGGTRRG